MEVGLYASHRLREHTRSGDLRLERHWFETAACRPCLGQSRVSDIRAADVSRPDMRLGGFDCFRDMLDVPTRGTGSCSGRSSRVPDIKRLARYRDN